MIRPRLHYRLCLLIALVAIWGSNSVLRAEQPPPTSAPAESKAAPPSPAKPQVIFRVPRTSGYTANLHSQSKTQSHPLPADNTTPSSPQTSRAPSNEPAAPPEQEQSAAETKPKNVRTSRQQNVRRPKMQSVRRQMHGPKSFKGQGKSRGKSGKK